MTDMAAAIAKGIAFALDGQEVTIDGQEWTVDSADETGPTIETVVTNAYGYGHTVRLAVTIAAPGDTQEPEATDWLEAAESKQITEAIRASFLPVVQGVAQAVHRNPRAAIDLARRALDEMAEQAAREQALPLRDLCDQHRTARANRQPAIAGTTTNNIELGPCPPIGGDMQPYELEMIDQIKAMRWNGPITVAKIQRRMNVGFVKAAKLLRHLHTEDGLAQTFATRPDDWRGTNPSAAPVPTEETP